MKSTIFHIESAIELRKSTSDAVSPPTEIVADCGRRRGRELRRATA